MLQGDGLGPLPHPAALSAGSSRRPGFARPPAPPSPQSLLLTAVTTRSREPTAGHIPAPGRGARYGPAPEAGRPPRPISARVPEAPPQTRPQHLRSTSSSPSIPSVNNSHLGEGRNKLKLRVIFRAGLICRVLLHLRSGLKPVGILLLVQLRCPLPNN